MAMNDAVMSMYKMAQNRARRKAMEKSADIRCTCGFCRELYRDNFGNSVCGIAQQGEKQVIPKPFDDGCRKWKPREGYQPPVFRSPEANKQFASKVNALKVASKCGYCNPISML